MFQCHIEKIARAAGRIEHPQRAEPMVKALELNHGSIVLVLGGQRERGGLG